MQNIELEIKEVLRDLMQEQIDKYPFTLEANDLAKILNLKDKSQIYRQLSKDKNSYPSAQKIPGIGWRFNRDIILTWLYSKEVNDEGVHD